MNELVTVRRGEVFTDSLTIADGTGNEHRAVKQLVKGYNGELSELGKVRISNDTLETNGGTQKITYMKSRREGKKNFSVLIDKQKASDIDKKLKQDNKTKSMWLEEKIDEELNKKKIDTSCFRPKSQACIYPPRSFLL